MSLDDEIVRFVDDLIDSCILDDVLNLHRAIKLGYFHLIAPDCNDASLQSASSGSSGGAASGDNQVASWKSEAVNKLHSCCQCAKCNCKVAATRYASHLSNCMGLGRNCFRRANKRIAEQQRLEDSDDVDEPYYLDSSPTSVCGIKSDTGDRISKHNQELSPASSNTRLIMPMASLTSSRSVKELSRSSLQFGRGNNSSSAKSGLHRAADTEPDFPEPGNSKPGINQSNTSIYEASGFYEDEDVEIDVSRRLQSGFSKRQHTKGHANA